MAVKAMAESPAQMSNEYSGALWEIGDFLFAAKSIAKIANGKGGWGDAFAVGISAASLFIPPLKLGKLATPALKAVVAESEKMLATDVVSTVGKKQLERTVNHANTLLNHSEQTRPMIAQQLEDGTFEITKVPTLSKYVDEAAQRPQTPIETQLEDLEPYQRERALRNIEEEKKALGEYVDDTNASEIQKSESTHPYDVANEEAKVANLEESARMQQQYPNATIIRDRESSIPETVKLSTVPRSQAAVDERLSRPTDYWERWKNVYENLNKKLPSDMKPYSALTPEGDELKNDFELLQHLTTYDIAADETATSKIVNVLESLAAKETDVKTKSIIESAITDLQINGVESDAFKQIQTVAQRKLNRIEKLREYWGDKTSPAFRKQADNIVPIIDKTTGKVDWVKPRSYQTLGKSSLSPNLPARSLPSEIESDIINAYDSMLVATTDAERKAALSSLREAQKGQAISAIRALRERWAAEYKVRSLSNRDLKTLTLDELQSEADRLTLDLKNITAMSSMPLKQDAVKQLQKETRSRLKKVVARLQNAQGREVEYYDPKAWGRQTYSTPSRTSRREAIATSQKTRTGNVVQPIPKKISQLSKAERRKLRPESKSLPTRRPTSSTQKVLDYKGNINATLPELMNELKDTRKQYALLKKATDNERNATKWQKNMRELDRLERQGKKIHSLIKRRKEMLKSKRSK